MPFVDVNGGRLHYRFDGDSAAPVLLLSNSLGTDLSMWDRQVAAMKDSFRILRLDTRGHGASLVTPGPYTIERLARDVVSLLDELEISRVHFCGLSLGGMVGIWLAAHEPARVDRLVLANTAAQLGPPELWDARIEMVRTAGMTQLADTVIERWFTATFRERSPADVEAARRTLLSTSPPGYTASCAAIRDMDQRGELKSIRSRTLVVVGRQDQATPPAMGHMIADAVVGSRTIELSAAHLSNIEAAASFNAAVLNFLET